MYKLTSAKSTNQILSIFGVALMLFALAGCDDKDKQPAPQLPQVGILVLEPVDVPSTVELAGRVASHATAEVRPQVSGIILKRLFEEGSNVIAGQQLYQIDPAVYQVQYDTAQANLKKAQTAVDNSKKIVDRYTEIIKVRGVSQQEFDTATATYNQNMAELAATKAAVQTAKINLDYTKVYSPVSGRAGISLVTEGALVTASQQTPLVYVQQMDPMYIDITQSSAEFLRLQRSLMDGTISSATDQQDEGQGGASLRVRLILEDGQPYVKYENGRPLLDADGKPVEHSARMLLYDAKVDQSTGSITMRAVVGNPDNLLLPGMFVRAVVTEGIIKNSLLVPLPAVQRTPRGEAQVMVINAEGKVESRIINSSRIHNNEAWIVLPGRQNGQGLDIGDKLIVEGLGRIREGMMAETYPAGSKPAPQMPIPGSSQAESTNQ